MSDNSETEPIKELFKTYRQMMYKTALGILRSASDAEDAVQNAFLWMINNPEKVARIPRSEIPLYLTYITEHSSIDIYRKQRSHAADDIDEHYELSSERFVEEEALSNLTVIEIRNALSELSDRDYDLLYLYLFKDKNYREIGKIMNIPENQVRVYIRRARKRFIKILKERGVIDDV